VRRCQGLTTARRLAAAFGAGAPVSSVGVAVVRRSKAPGGSAAYRPVDTHIRRQPLQTQVHCPEIDCVRDLLPRRVIAAAERRALSVGLGADRVLICADVITEDGYLTALATSLGTFFDPLENLSRARCPLSDDQLIEAAATGLLPLQEGDQLCWIIAPRCLTARQLVNLGVSARQRPSFRLTSPDRLSRFVDGYARAALGRRAASDLRRWQPHLSNAPGAGGSGFIAIAATAAVSGASFAAAPSASCAAVAALCSAAILAGQPASRSQKKL
jgi:glycosyltransferase XagB